MAIRPTSEVLNIELDEQELREIERRLGDLKDKLPTIIARAINRGLARMRTKTVRRAREETGIRSRTIRSRITLNRATRNRMRGRLRIWDKGFNLADFDPQENELGVQAKIGSRLHQVQHAFIATTPSGHIGVFIRGRGSAGPFPGSIEGEGFYSGATRLPIHAVRTKGIASTLRRAAALGSIEREGNDYVRERLQVETDLILSGQRT